MKMANPAYKNIPVKVILFRFTEGMTLTGTHCTYKINLEAIGYRTVGENTRGDQ